MRELPRVEGKVALVTGAARGQGRSHAIRLAEEGADIIAVDICDGVESIRSPLGTAEELADTGLAVERLGRRIVTAKADVRDQNVLRAAVDEGVSELGRLDVVIANAGICTIQSWDEVTPQLWQDTIDIDLTGVWNTCFVALPHLIAAGGGSVIITSSSAGIKGQPFVTPYAAAKHGVVGIMRSLANELAKHEIRVNTVHPTGVDTPMQAELTRMDELIATDPNVGSLFQNALPVRLIESVDVSNVVLFLASDEARYVTGLQMTVDAGATVR